MIGGFRGRVWPKAGPVPIVSSSLVFVDGDKEFAFADALGYELVAGTKGGIVDVHPTGAVTFLAIDALDDACNIVGIGIEPITFHLTSPSSLVPCA